MAGSTTDEVLKDLERLRVEGRQIFRCSARGDDAIEYDCSAWQSAQPVAEALLAMTLILRTKGRRPPELDGKGSGNRKTEGSALLRSIGFQTEETVH